MHRDKLTDAGVTINPVKFMIYIGVALTFSDCRPNLIPVFLEETNSDVTLTEF
jgi:hypothetical protein